MNQLTYNTGAFRAVPARDTQTSHQKIFGFVFALSMEAAIVWALLISLGYAPKPAPIPIFEGRIIPVENKNVDLPPPPPPQFEAPVTRPVEPIITLEYTPPVQEHAITPQTVDPPQRVATVEPPPMPKFVQAQAIMATHTTPDYPPISRRLNEQGTLRLRLSITADGAVRDAMVEQSSGHQRLDDAAIAWVKGHWRYHPATEGARTVASTLSAIVTFKLQ